MTETKPLPEIAKTAFAQFQAQVNDGLGRLAGQTLEAMGLSAADGWKVDLQVGAVVREVTESKPELVQAS